MKLILNAVKAKNVQSGEMTDIAAIQGPPGPKGDKGDPGAGGDVTKEYVDTQVSNLASAMPLYKYPNGSAGPASGSNNGAGSFAYNGNAMGTNGFAAGSGSTTADSNYASAIGSSTVASGQASFATGDNTQAKGRNSHTEGWYTEASGNNSHAEGSYTKADGNEQHVTGRYNIPDESSAVIVGNGTAPDDDKRSNAATVGFDGNVWFAGDVYVGSTSGKNKDEGSDRLARSSEVSGYDSRITTVENELQHQEGLINGVRTEIDNGWDSQANYIPNMIRSITTGALIDRSGWCVSDYISIEPGAQYSFYVNQRYNAANAAIFFDKDKQLVRVVENTINSPYGMYPLFNHVWLTAQEGEVFMTFCDTIPTSDNVANLKVMRRTSEEPAKDYWLAEMPTHHNGLKNHESRIGALEASGGGSLPYTLEEQAIGVWYNGKTIYRQIYSIGTGLYTWKQSGLGHNIASYVPNFTNMEHIISSKCFGDGVPVCGYCSVWYETSSPTVLNFLPYTEWGQGYSKYLILEYTKR